MRTELQVERLYISFSSFIFTGAPYWIFLPSLPWLHCHVYLVVIAQQQQQSCAACVRAGAQFHAVLVMNRCGKFVGDTRSKIFF